MVNQAASMQRLPNIKIPQNPARSMISPVTGGARIAAPWLKVYYKPV
jgi:hypothetical protein